FPTRGRRRRLRWSWWPSDSPPRARQVLEGRDQVRRQLLGELDRQALLIHVPAALDVDLDVDRDASATAAFGDQRAAGGGYEFSFVEVRHSLGRNGTTVRELPEVAVGFALAVAGASEAVVLFVASLPIQNGGSGDSCSRGAQWGGANRRCGSAGLDEALVPTNPFDRMDHLFDEAQDLLDRADAFGEEVLQRVGVLH